MICPFGRSEKRERRLIEIKLKAIIGIVLTLLLLITVTLTLISTNIPLLARSRHTQVFQGKSTEVCGYISENTTWTLAGSPYTVVCDVIVEPGAFLTIEPKAIVEFANGRNLVIYGGLVAQGNTTHEITFTSNSTTPFPGDWGSVRFKGTHFLMSHVLVEYATKGLEFLTSANISNSVISNCTTGIEGKLGYANNLTVTDNTGDGLSLSSSLCIENSNISSNGGHGIAITANIDMDNCVILNNMGNGVILSNGGSIKNSIIADNRGNGTCILGSATMENTTISSNGGDGIWTKSSTSVAKCNITRNEKNGVRGGYVDGSMIIQNSNISYNAADGIWTNSSVEIKGCDITYNEGDGIIAANIAHMTVSQSNIRNNTLSGLSGSGYVFNSTVSGNKLCGISGNFTIESYTSITWNQGGGFNGTGSIYWSSIFNNTPFDAVADVWPNNITAHHNWWGYNATIDAGALIEEHIWHHNDNESLGYVFYEPWLESLPKPVDNVHPEIIVTSPYPYNGTSPTPYILWIGFSYYPMIRMNEPVRVSVNVTDNGSPLPSGVDKVFFLYRVNSGNWWNTTMTLTQMYNETSGNWDIIIPGQLGNSTVEFFIEAFDKAGNVARSPEPEDSYHSYTIRWLPIGDVNGDGRVRVDDVLAVALQFGQG